MNTQIKWNKVQELLPDTSAGTKDRNTEMVIVAVKTNKGKIYVCQFRRFVKETGGVFCGIIKPIYTDSHAYQGIYCIDWYPLGDTSFLRSYHEIEICSWRFATDKESKKYLNSIMQKEPS